MIGRGCSVNEPEVDRGTDMIALKDKKVALIQIKTVIMSDDKEYKTVTASGSKNGSLKERYEGRNLVVLCMSKSLERRYSLVFSSSELPDVQSLKILRNKSSLGKYERYVDAFENLSFSTI
ncbi:hypothetical protein SVXNc_1088 [Candidatus Nanohalococcus occultus]|uniref:PD(D/E)XK endonuclease domain-containing protein n=2 Tax=Candidatus Nanohalococcus occultus TaxID=2978047 RepID=A0ABY8CKC4_9ARCH|nr:hypothetical protein SVXNc_1088 [Candidatus Nanohaloarchaeota archaeon SVXNc]